MAVNKVVYNGSTLVDLTDTTAQADDVKSGKVFYSASGERSIGSGNGSEPVNYASSQTVAGPADKAVSIPFGQVAADSVSTAFTAEIEGIAELRDGICVMLRNGVVTSASGWTLNINGLGAKPVYSTMGATTRITTTFNVNYTMLFIYNSTRVSGGCWDMYYGYNAGRQHEQRQGVYRDALILCAGFTWNCSGSLCQRRSSRSDAQYQQQGRKGDLLSRRGNCGRRDQSRGHRHLHLQRQPVHPAWNRQDSRTAGEAE